MSLPCRSVPHEFYAIYLHPPRASVKRWKSHGHILAFHPELVLLVTAVIHRENHTRPARPAARHPRTRVAMPAGGPKVFHEFGERVTRARFGVRAAEHGVRGLIVMGAHKRQKLLD